MANRYQALVAEARQRIEEISPQEVASQRERLLVIDVRERDEWQEGRIPGAKHASRGTLEVKIEELAPDPATLIVCHCAMGGRSALAAESLQKMGYTNVRSMAGGIKAWQAAGLPIER